MLTICFADQCSGEASQRRSTRDRHFKEFTATCEPSPSGSPRILCYLRIRFRSEAHRCLDSRLSILAEFYLFQPEDLGICSNRMEAIGIPVPRTCRNSATGRRHYGIGCQERRTLPRVIASSYIEGSSSSPSRVLVHRGCSERSSRFLCLSDARPFLFGTPAGCGTR